MGMTENDYRFGLEATGNVNTDFVNAFLAQNYQSGRDSSGAISGDIDNVIRARLSEQFRGTEYEGWENNSAVFAAWREYYVGFDSVTGGKLANQTSMSRVAYAIKQAGGGDNNGPGNTGPSVAQRAAGIEAQYRNLAAMFGMPDQDWSAAAYAAAQNNWTADMIQDAVAEQITMEAAKRGGLVKNVISKSKAAGADYFVNVSDDEALGWAKKIASGDMTEESIVPLLRDRAKAQYYWLAPVIEQGTTMKEYFQPQRDTIAKLLEKSPESVDFMNDGRWANVIRRPPTTDDGSDRAMNLYETAKYVRGMEEWQKTSNAKETASQGVSALAKIFGAL